MVEDKTRQQNNSSVLSVTLPGWSKNEYIFEYVQECENELWNFNGNLSFVEIYTI